MKKKFFTGFFGAAMLLSFAACSEQEDIIPFDDTKGADVFFSLDIQDFATRAETSEDCKTMDELKSLADDDNLMVRFTIENTIYEGGKKSFERKLKFTSAGVIADPVALAMSGNVLSDFVVYDASTDEEPALYSAIGEGSPMFSKYVSDTEDLPMDISIADGEEYEKITCPIVVACATNSTPEEFGFKMWDITFIKRFNIPYVVNNCYEDGLHFVASGKINVYNADIDEQGNLIPEKEELLYTSEFGDGPSDLWIMDNYAIDNDKEWYYMELIVDEEEGSNNDVRSGWINVADALNFEDFDDYISEFNVLDINLCGNTPVFVGKKSQGTYWVEDLWGIKNSDSDYNDLIVEYTYNKYYVQTYKSASDTKGKRETVPMLHSINMNFKFVAKGTSNINAFAMRFNNLDESDLNGEYLPYTIWEQGPNGGEYNLVTDENKKFWDIQDFELFKTDKGVLVLPVKGNLNTAFRNTEGIVNTYNDQDYIKGVWSKVNVTFKTYVPADVDVSPMLLYSAKDGHEINMPGLEPSSSEAQSFYDEVKGVDGIEDKYIIKKGDRYLPWIIDIPNKNVAYASEKRSIETVFSLGDWGKDKDFTFSSDDDKWYNSHIKAIYEKYPF